MGDFLRVLVQPENLAFSTSLMIFSGLLALLFLGLLGGGFGSDVDFDLVDVDLDVDIDIDVSNTPSDVEGVSEPARFPLICFLMPFLASFGFIGLLSNWLLSDAIGNLITKTLVSVVVSAFIGFELSQRLATFIANALPSVSTYGLSAAKLEGSLGRVVSERMTSAEIARFSTIDSRGNTYTLQGQLVDGQSEVLHGEAIRVVEHDVKSGVCFCTPATADAKRNDGLAETSNS